MKEEKKSTRFPIEEFLDSEENQKKYGFTTKIENVIRSIYYNGDMDALEEVRFSCVRRIS